MKKDKQNDEMRAEYDLTKLKGRVQGKYVARYNSGTNLVALDDDIAKEFKDSQAVNTALRSLIASNPDRLSITK
jgi:hypothetical protein